ncbi:putative OPA3-like protein CG13603 isoform X2 [Culicoides brevitarsis]|uniref:putative OPA3-like protein CG13603 isoform X2 n=1 Tax=Culicoides brevitarsis TaxID=469753 RepID=UPI00307B24B2
MVVGAFPAAKLGVLAMKQISKPIANVLKTRAKNSPFFRTYICMPPAQFYNWMEVKTRMWAMNLGKPTVVPTLNEAQAIELGANLLGEFVIFTIGAGLLILEYTRSSRKEAMKEAMVEQEKAELHAYINELAFRLEKQDAQLREMERVVASLHSSRWTPVKILSDLTTSNSNKKAENDDRIRSDPVTPLGSSAAEKKSETSISSPKEEASSRSR